MINLYCNECGTASKLPSSTKFYTCSNCGTALRVISLGQGYYTEKNQYNSTQKILATKKKKELPPKLHLLDEEWKDFKQNSTFLGIRISEDANIIATVLSIIFVITSLPSIYLALGAMFNGSEDSFTIYIFIFLGSILGLITNFQYANSARTYKLKKSEYQQKRDEIWRQTGALKKNYKRYY